MSAEADLWAAVLKLALADACHSEKLSRGKESNASPSQRDVAEAWAFLTEAGEWGAHREWIGTLNGLNPGIARAAALQMGPSRATRAALCAVEVAVAVKQRKARPGSHAERNG